MSVTAEAVASRISCNNEIVLVPDRGRIDKVKRTLIVKVSNTSTNVVLNGFNLACQRALCCRLMLLSIIFQAEGTEKVQTYNWLLCPKGECSLCLYKGH